MKNAKAKSTPAQPDTSGGANAQAKQKAAAEKKKKDGLAANMNGI